MDQKPMSIEDFPNEFFYELFDYLPGYHIHFAFSNLNYRFEQILNSSSLLYKIPLEFSSSKEWVMENYKRIFHLNNNQILSLHLWAWSDTNHIYSLLNFDLSYHRLESLVFGAIEPDILRLLLSQLYSLPSLFSLTIDTESLLKDLGDIYQLIFKLPKLKYINCTAMESTDFDITISLPMATNEQITSIEHLILNHSCTVNELSTLLSYTPHVRRLKFLNLSPNTTSVRTSLIASYLTHLSIQAYHMTFNELERIIRSLSSQLKVLFYTTYTEDIGYLNANRWERLILQHLPQLEKFNFKYYAYFNNGYATPVYTGKANEFFSSFWIERKWIFEAEIDDDNIIYAIHPYKTRWYEQHQSVPSFDQLSKLKRLVLSGVPSERRSTSLSIDDYFSHIFTMLQIHHIEIHSQIFIVSLGEVFCLLPEVESLELYRISFSYPRKVTEEELEALYLLSIKNPITTVCLGKMHQIEEVYFVMAFCPRISHLQVNDICGMNAVLFVRLLLMTRKIRSIDTLRFLCFDARAADDDMVRTLEEMIHVEGLVDDCTVKRVMDKIYLKWK